MRTGAGVYRTSVNFDAFADGDTYCAIQDVAHISGAHILIHHQLYPNQNEQVVRLLFLVGALLDLGAARIEVFVPYLPYARQDKAHLPGEAVTSHLLCRLLHRSGVSRLYTIDCHFMSGAATTVVEGLPIHNILVQDQLIAALHAYVRPPYHVIGPDDGSAYLAQDGTMKKARAEKYRHSSDGSIQRAVETLDPHTLTLAGGTFVVVDDIISTGSTMLKALETLQQRNISDVYVVVTHALFLHDSFDKIAMLSRGVIYADTITRKGSIPVVDAIYENLIKAM